MYKISKCPKNTLIVVLTLILAPYQGALAETHGAQSGGNLSLGLDTLTNFTTGDKNTAIGSGALWKNTVSGSTEVDAPFQVSATSSWPKKTKWGLQCLSNEHCKGIEARGKPSVCRKKVKYNKWSSKNQYCLKKLWRRAPCNNSDQCTSGICARGVCTKSSSTSLNPATGKEGPRAEQTPIKNPTVLINEIKRQKMPQLSSPGDVKKFIAWASRAPVSRREEIRRRVSTMVRNNSIAQAMISEFKKSELKDHSRSIVILALLGEMRNGVGAKFLSKYIWEPLPKDGIIMKESGVSSQYYNKELLQVQAVTGLSYMRTGATDKVVLRAASSHPSPAVRAEAVSTFLWNHQSSNKAREILRRAVRKGEEKLIDRPVRTNKMTAAQFNAQLDAYLRKYPELVPPAPVKAKGQKRSDEKGPTKAEVGPPPRLN